MPPTILAASIRLALQSGSFAGWKKDIFQTKI
jgi:hypothetical protein